MAKAASNIHSKSVSRRAALAGAVAVAIVPTAAIALPAAQPSTELDHPAILARGEEIIYRLQTRYIREGWSPDPEGGERMLRYLRRCVAEPGYDDPEEFVRGVVGFMGRNNQSLTWLLSGEPGGMICSLAAISQQAAAQADPVFAAIEKHRELEAAYVAACNAADDRYSEDAAHQLGHAAHKALGALVATTPTTLMGCSAALRHLEAHVESYDYEAALFANASEVVSTPAEDFLSRIAKTLEASAGRS